MKIDIQTTIQHLRKTAGLVLPYGITPGSYLGGLNSDFDEERWNAYSWNPPGGLEDIPEFEAPDPTASEKPTWAELVAINEVAVLADLRVRKVYLANTEATRRIAIVYHPDAIRDRNKEWQVRLSGTTDLTIQNAERVRLVTLCHEIEERIAAATTIVELEAIDPTDDSEWA